MMSLKEKYNKEAIKVLKEKLSLDNVMQVPKIEKVVVNVGVGKFLKDGNAVNEIMESIKNITGQKPVMTKSKKSIAGFKIREGLEVGIKATLRGKRMWNFIEKLVGAAIPRIKDFRGIKESAIDDNGNMNLGIKEHLIFPEIFPEHVKVTYSLQVNITTNAKNKEKGMMLFRILGFPIEQK